MDIRFVRYSPHTSEHSVTAQLVECYRDVFADGPWHEWFKCPICKRFWGTKDKELLHSLQFRHCDVAMVDFWPREQVSSDLHHEIILESSAWLAVDGEKVVGFCWGYPITFDELEAKLELPVGHVSKGSERVAYQDDVGILAPYRRQGFARKMITLRHDDFIAQGLSIGITRTRELPEPSVTHTWYTRDLGYKIVARYPGDDGRVVLARPLDGLRELLN